MDKNNNHKLARRNETSLVNVSNQIATTNKILKSIIDKQLSLFSAFTDPRDGNVYKIVKIVDQVWMAENLRYIPHVSPPEEQGGIWVYGYHGHNINEAIATDGYKEDGCFYDWETILKICPSGWHVPTDAEWKILGNSLGMAFEDSDPTGFRGRNKFTQFKKVRDWNNGKTYITSFGERDGWTVIPRGWRRKWSNSKGQFDSIGFQGTYWSSPEVGSEDDWSRASFVGNNFSNDRYGSNSYGLAVRLIKD